MKEIKIDAKKLKELERAQAKLNALERGGVDNWEFYDEALTEYSDTIELEEMVESLIEDIEPVFLQGVYEPSERGAGFCATEEAREETVQIILNFIKKIKEE